MKRIHSRSDAYGQAMVEFALTFTIFVLLFVGFLGMGIVLFSYVTTTAAAREGARYLIEHPTATDAQIHAQICATSPGLGGTEPACLNNISSGEVVVIVEPVLAQRVPMAQVSVTVRFHVPLPTASVSFLDQSSFTFIQPIWVSSTSVMRIEQ